MKIVLASVACVVGTNCVLAQTTTVTKTAPAPVAVKIGSATVAPSATTIYTMPAKSPDGGPTPGNQRGSSTNTSYGATITIPFPEKKR